jgi:roundabout, axon guidance receptor 2
LRKIYKKKILIKLQSFTSETLILDVFCIFNQVEKSATSILHRSPDSSLLPIAPSEPKLINVSSTSITIGWNKVQLKQGGTSFFGYTVEYFSSETHKTWITAAQRVPNNIVTVSLQFPSFAYSLLPSLC